MKDVLVTLRGSPSFSHDTPGLGRPSAMHRNVMLLPTMVVILEPILAVNLTVANCLTEEPPIMTLGIVGSVKRKFSETRDTKKGTRTMSYIKD